MKVKEIIDKRTNQSNRQSFCQELTLYLHSVGDNLKDSLLAGLVHQVAEHQAGEACVQALESKKILDN